MGSSVGDQGSDQSTHSAVNVASNNFTLNHGDVTPSFVEVGLLIRIICKFKVSPTQLNPIETLLNFLL